MNHLLTAKLIALNITSLLPYEAVGIGVLVTSRRKPLSCGFFMLKISALHHYVGLGKALFGVAGFVKPVRQPYSVRLHDWRYVVGFKTLFTEAIMPNNHAQESTEQKPIHHVSLITAYFALKGSQS